MHTHIQTDRHIHTQTDRHTHIQTDRHIHIQTDRHIHTQTDRHIHTQTDRHTHIQTYRHIHTQTAVGAQITRQLCASLDLVGGWTQGSLDRLVGGLSTNFIDGYICGSKKS